MEIIYKNVDELIPYKYNPRKNDKAVEFVANSIKEFGFKVPIIVDGNNEIIAGHTRIKASKMLGIKEVPCIVANDLNEEQIKAFRLADNKVGELAEWQPELLSKELEELFGKFNMNEFGFSVQIENLMEGVENPEQIIAGELGEANNYIVLEFKTERDWDKAFSVFGLKELYTNMPNKEMRGKGICRVIDGAEVIKRLIDVEN